MSETIEKPEYLKNLLTDPSKMKEWIKGRVRYYYDHYDKVPFSWDVKFRGLLDRESLETLVLEAVTDYVGEEWARDQEFLDRLWEQFDEDDSDFFYETLSDAQRSVKDDDIYHTLWDGTELDVEFQFWGRNGGHLCLIRFEGVRLVRMEDYELHDWLEEMDEKSLRRFYEFLVQCDYLFTTESVKSEVRHVAAFNFVNNVAGAQQIAEEIQAERLVNVGGDGI